MYKRYTYEYMDILSDHYKDLFDTILEDPKEREKMELDMFTTVFDPEKENIDGRDASDKDMFFARKLMAPMLEICGNITALGNIPIYINSFPYKKHGVSRVDYLRYHIENYLNEFYILKKRLLAYITVVLRAYRKCKRFVEIENRLKPLCELISNVFEENVNLRGGHVHASRFSNYRFHRLGMLEILSKSSDIESKTAIAPMFSAEYKKMRKYWRSKMKNEISAIEELVGLYSQEFIAALTADRRVLYPSAVKWV